MIDRYAAVYPSIHIIVAGVCCKSRNVDVLYLFLAEIKNNCECLPSLQNEEGGRTDLNQGIRRRIHHSFYKTSLNRVSLFISSTSSLANLLNIHWFRSAAAAHSKEEPRSSHHNLSFSLLKKGLLLLRLLYYLDRGVVFVINWRFADGFKLS